VLAIDAIATVGKSNGKFSAEITTVFGEFGMVTMNVEAIDDTNEAGTATGVYQVSGTLIVVSTETQRLSGTVIMSVLAIEAITTVGTDDGTSAKSMITVFGAAVLKMTLDGTPDNQFDQSMTYVNGIATGLVNEAGILTGVITVTHDVSATVKTFSVGIPTITKVGTEAGTFSMAIMTYDG
jgi:hypothetical protein